MTCWVKCYNYKLFVISLNVSNASLCNLTLIELNWFLKLFVETPSSKWPATNARRQCRVWAPASPRTVWWRYLRRLAWPLGTLAMPCLGGTWGQAWWETGCSSPTYSWWSPSSWCLPAGQPTPQGGICAQPWLPSPHPPPPQICMLFFF